MVINYTTFTSSDEQDFLVKLDDFIQNHVGWYRIDTISDTSSNKDYVYVSDGEPDQTNNNPRYIRLQGTSNEFRFRAYSTYVDSGTNTGEITDSTNTQIQIGAGPHQAVVIADKERVMVASKSSPTSIHTFCYVGRVHSFYSAHLDPYPNAVKGTRLDSYDWDESSSNNQWYAIGEDETQYSYEISTANDMAAASSPNPRNNQFSFFNPTLFLDGVGAQNELRGKVRGAYQVANRLSSGSYVTLASGTHLVHKGLASATTWCFGPLTDPRIGDPNRIPPSVAEVDYDFRGFIADGNTLANWRLDAEVGGEYVDQTGTYNLTPANSPTLVNSPLVQAVDFNGSTQSASGNGNAAAATALTGEWTCEISFKPDTIPGSGADVLLEFGFDSEGTDSENILLNIGLAPSNEIRVLWEDTGGSDISNTTSAGGFIVQDRWNYLAVVKKSVGGGNYDIEVWHASFGDNEPVLRETFSSVSNAVGGSDSDWYLATDSSTTDYFDGQIDAVRVQEEVLTPAQIKTSASRVRL